MAADRDDAGDGRHRAHRFGDGEDLPERQVLQAAGDVPVDAGVGLQVVVHERSPVHDQHRQVLERFHGVPGGPQRTGHGVQVVGQEGHGHRAEVGAHHRLVAGVGVRARVTEGGPAHRHREAGAGGQSGVRVDQAQTEAGQGGQLQVPAVGGAPVVEEVAEGVGGGVPGPQGSRVGHGTDAESVEDDDDGLAHEGVSWSRARPSAS